MEAQELKNIWHAYDQKLEKSLALNIKLFDAIQKQKTENKLKSFYRNQLTGIVLGILWCVFLGILVFNTSNKPFFTVSVGAILLFNVFATLLYIYHIIILSQINISESITETQEKLAKVKTSFHQTGRVLILQSPFYCTWFLNKKMLTEGGVEAWLVPLSITLLFTILSIWLYFKLSLKNSHIKWVAYIQDTFGGKTLRNAEEFLKEIEEFKKG